MSNTIQPLASQPAAEPVAPAGGRNTAKSGGDYKAAESTAATAPPCLNPSLHIDGALGLVVIEFYGSDGQLTSSIPTAHQLDAYRRVAGVTTRGAGAGTGADAPGTAAVGAGAGEVAPHSMASSATPPNGTAKAS